MSNTELSSHLVRVVSAIWHFFNGKHRARRIYVYQTARIKQGKLQRLQNTLARVVTNSWSHYSGTRRSALAAGAVSDRVYKIALITFKALTTQQQQYLAELIRYYEHPDNCDLAAKTFYRTVHQFLTFLSVLFVMPHLQSGIVFLKLLFLI